MISRFSHWLGGLALFGVIFTSTASAEPDIPPTAAEAAEISLASLKQENVVLREKLKRLEAQLAVAQKRILALQEQAGVATDQIVVAEQAQRVRIVEPAVVQGEAQGGQAGRVIAGPVVLSERDGTWADHTVRFGVPMKNADDADADPVLADLVIRAEYSGKDYADHEQAVLVLNGDERVTLTRTAYDRDFSQRRVRGKLRDMSTETVTFALSLDQMRSLAHARQSTLEIGRITLTLDRDHRALAKALLLRLQPAAPATAPATNVTK